MSSALVRQALAFVDPEENSKAKRSKRRQHSNRDGGIGQVAGHPYKQKSKKQNKVSVKSKEQIAEENIKKLLALSAPTADSKIAEKIVERAIKGKPLLEKIEIKKEEEKSILFPEETFKEFEKSYFCS